MRARVRARHREPVKIVDLSEERIKLSGYTPDNDSEAVCAGIRPGETCVIENASRTMN